MKKDFYSLEEAWIISERFVKKYKRSIVAIISLAILVFISNTLYNIIEENKKIKTNDLYIKLIENKDLIKLKELKELNKNLYLGILLNEKYSDELTVFKTTNEDELLIDIYNLRENSSKYFLKDLILIKNAYKLLKENKIAEGKSVLDNISNNSLFYKIATNLKHYQGI